MYLKIYHIDYAALRMIFFLTEGIPVKFLQHRFGAIFHEIKFIKAKIGQRKEKEDESRLVQSRPLGHYVNFYGFAFHADLSCRAAGVGRRLQRG